MLFVLLLLFISYKFNKTNNDWFTSPLFYGIVALKCVYAVIYVSVYTWFYHGEGDMFLFISNTQELIQYIGYSPAKYVDFIIGDYKSLQFSRDLYDSVVLEPRISVFLKVFYLFFLASFSSMYLSIVALILLSSWIIFKAYCSDVIKHKKAFLITFVFLPSYSFWTSGISKEAFILPVLLWIFIELAEINSVNNLFKKIWWILPLLVWVFKVKYYYGFLFLLFTLYYVALTRFKISKRYLLLVSLAIGGIALAIAPYLHPYLSLKLLPELIQVNYQMFCPDTTYITCVQLPVEGSWGSIFYSLPKSALFGMFAPWIGQGHNILALVLSIENTLIIVATIYLIYLLVKKRVSLTSADFVLCFGVLISASLICMAAPNLGSLSRYKEIYWPLWVFVMVKYILPQIVHRLPKWAQ
ncbi:MAG: hypothetical protein U0U66_01395 [Cytophagaceae bacterium]